MRRSGFIVRFVDVVLILLFGFISISSVRVTEVDLPSSTETPTAAPERAEVYYVSIREDGTFLVDDEMVELRGGRALLDHLAGVVEATGDSPLTVRIRASGGAPVFFLMEASRICDQLGVPKAFEVLMAGREA
jgi:biopolymer transport protein ExbD